eukprot:gene338-350_t
METLRFANESNSTAVTVSGTGVVVCPSLSTSGLWTVSLDLKCGDLECSYRKSFLNVSELSPKEELVYFKQSYLSSLGLDIATGSEQEIRNLLSETMTEVFDMAQIPHMLMPCHSSAFRLSHDYISSRSEILSQMEASHTSSISSMAMRAFVTQGDSTCLEENAATVLCTVVRVVVVVSIVDMVK